MRESSLIGHLLEFAAAGDPLPSDIRLQQFFRRRRYLGPRERRFISDRYFGILRNRRLLETMAASGAEASGIPLPSSHAALYALYALVFCGEERERLPALVAPFWGGEVHPGDLARWLEAASMADLPSAVKADPAELLAVETSMPSAAAAEWTARLGVEEARRLARALNEEAPVVVRVNTLRADRDRVMRALEREGVEAAPTPYAPAGLILARRIPLGGSASFAAGSYELQDEGSQILSHLLEVEPGMTVLDACAGAGGKSLHLAALMENRGLIVATDADRRRLLRLPPRARRSGASIVRVAPEARPDAVYVRMAGKADAVILDVPCSGTGIYRRSPWLKFPPPGAWERLEAVQADILRACAPCVRPGGRLLYCTCALRQAENEAQIARFLAAHPVFHQVPAGEILRRQGIAIDSGGAGLTLAPHRTGTDGFFAAVLVRESR
ncbi:MAG: RsmB/NOP family class I SAM-dependent RNA methyltransferase [Bacteroidota bacterium]